MSCKTVILAGLSIGKGQRLCDLQVANSCLSDQELKEELASLLCEGLVESYAHPDDVYYFKKDPASARSRSN